VDPALQLGLTGTKLDVIARNAGSARSSLMMCRTIRARC